MKKVIVLLAVLAVAANAYAAIDGSAHDFVDGSGDWTGTTEVCQPCHVPHASAAATEGAPLWNHAVTTFSIAPYNSGTMTGADRSAAVPTGITKLCLSCHDGSVGLDSFGGVTTGATKLTAGDEGFLNTLATSHPVGIVYDTSATADADIKTADAAINALLDGGATGTVECSSCHDVHNGASQDALLRETNAGSALCLKCHSK